MKKILLIFIITIGLFTLSACSTSMEDKAYTEAKNIVQMQAKFPDSLKFQDDKKVVIKNNNQYEISGVCSAKDALGIEKQINFTMKLTENNGIFSSSDVNITEN